jgi:branched-chain amino acid transport system ATP-binding protein
MMLKVQNVSVSYGQHRALEDVSIGVGSGEIVVILGANGAGKSTLLRAISGISEGTTTGSVVMDGSEILGLSSDRIVENGVALVPEGRGIFGELSVKENLVLGAYSNRARPDESTNLERVYGLFPKLQERRGQIAQTMSGGEQQMVAIGRAMMSNPKILMLDEPSLGLSPLLCKELFANLKKVRGAGIGILLVEQNAKQSLAISDRGYLLENAHIVHEGPAAELANDPAVQRAYLGAGTQQQRPASAVPVRDFAGDPEGIGERANSAATITANRAPPRKTADQLLNMSVDHLVKAAAQHAPKSVSLNGRGDMPTGHDAALRAALSGIERAAKSAAKSAGDFKTVLPAMGEPTVPTMARQSAAEKPVVIEVYRAPRVEVYRRRDGKSEFQRDE